MKSKRKINIVLQQKLIYAGAILIGLNFIVIGFEWTIVLGLMPFLYYLDNLTKISKRRAYIDFYISGVVIYSFAYKFLLDIEPANWQFIYSKSIGIFTAVSAWVLAFLISALSFLLVPLLAYNLKTKKIVIITFPLIWVFAEIFSALGYSLISYGSGGVIGFDVNFGSIATLASNLPIVYSARIFGFYGVSIIMGFIAMAIYWTAVYREYFKSAVIIVAVLILSFIGFKLPATNKNKTLKVVAVHMNEQNTAKDIEFLPGNIDILVLPEYSEIQKSHNFSEVLSKLSNDGVMITTRLEGRSPEATNKLIYINKSGKEVSIQAKYRLIPGGEYMPYSLQAALKLIRKQEVIDLFNYSQKIKQGEKEVSNVNYGLISFGSLPCSGVLSQKSYKKLVNNGADVLINPASLSLLKESSQYHVLAKRMARFQAIYNNKVFVQASRSGGSYVVMPNGRFLVSNKGNSTQYIKTKINF